MDPINKVSSSPAVSTPTVPPLNPVQSRTPWLGVVVVAIIISFGVSLLTGYLTGGKLSNLFSRQSVKGEVPGVTTQVSSAEEESAVISAVEKVRPAVASIVVTKDLSKMSQNNFFFPFSFEIPSSGQGQEQEIGGGTGFFISADGLLLTNKHVVQDQEAEYTIILQDGTKYDNVKVLARDPVEDMALLKVNGDSFTPLDLGDSDTLRVGQTVIAIGNALGQYQNSVTKGIVSGLGRNITAGDSWGASTERLQNIIQTDAAINSGNSGGPLVNLEGQVIGMNTAVDFSGQLVGFAIPINSMKNEIQSVRDTGKIVKPYLGVRYVLLNKQIAAENSLPFDYGALVLRGQRVTDLAVLPGSPADKAGIEENDIILEIDGQKITEDNDLTELVNSHQVGDGITLKIWQDGKEKEVKVTLQERPAS